MPFELIPAIDLMNGSCVRLAQGVYEDKTVYGENPGEVAAGFAAHSIRRLHVVDLDGAKAGQPVNTPAIEAIVAGVGPNIPVQLGGGIRDMDAVARALDVGISRVILGTVALREPELVREAARKYPNQIVVGIDARDGRVAVEGWLDVSDARATDLAKSFEDAGVAAIVYTDISRDGMLTGPNLEATVELARSVRIPVIVSGGVSCEDDIVAAAKESESGIAGIIVGKALYTGAVDLPAALSAILAVEGA
jgi:phosphoribosylformimino-5-aminoimidazole carboxamide ribotide isomerase